MADDDAARRKQLREAILRHLRAHPFAADTAKGIVSDWLPAALLAHAPAHIEAVLADMTEEGQLLAYPLPGGRVLYKKGSAAR